MLLRAISQFRKSREVADWPVAMGRILSSEMGASRNTESGTNYFVNVSYEYSVMGTTHKGDRIALAYMGSQNPEMEHKLLEMLPVGRQVEVRYDPGDPQQSVLAHGIHSSTVFFLIFSIMLLSFLLSFLMMLWIRLRPDQVLLDSLRVHWDREASP